MPHIHAKIDFTASVYIVHVGKVLLRKHEKYYLWLPPGGHIEFDEDPNVAALREAKEEVGLDIKLWTGEQKLHSTEKNPFGVHRELVPPVALNRHHLPHGHEHVDFTYVARADSDAVVPEHLDDEWRWLAKDELDSLELMPHVRFYAALAIDTLSV